MYLEVLAKYLCPSDKGPGESGLSQGLESHHLSEYSSQDTASLQEEADSQSSRFSSRDVTPHTSVSERIQGRVLKKARKGARL
jgi:hypothetical protein